MKLGAAAVTKGSAAVKVNGLAAGKHTIVVSFSGDANHSASSLTFTYTVKSSK